MFLKKLKFFGASCFIDGLGQGLTIDMWTRGGELPQIFSGVSMPNKRESQMFLKNPVGIRIYGHFSRAINPYER